MRSRLCPSHVSFVAWAALVTAGLGFAACANGTTASGAAIGGSASEGDSGVSTQVSEDAGTGSNVGNPNGGDDAGTPTSDDAGSPSKGGADATAPDGNDAGLPTSDDAGSGTSGDDAGTSPPSSSVCPDTSLYQDEYAIALIIGGTSCTTNTDCSSGNCCYAGSDAIDGPLCVVQ